MDKRTLRGRLALYAGGLPARDYAVGTRLMQALLQFFEPVQRDAELYLGRPFGGLEARSDNQKLFAVWRDVVRPDGYACPQHGGSDWKLGGIGNHRVFMRRILIELAADYTDYADFNPVNPCNLVLRLRAVALALRRLDLPAQGVGRRSLG